MDKYENTINKSLQRKQKKNQHQQQQQQPDENSCDSDMLAVSDLHVTIVVAATLVFCVQT